MTLAAADVIACEDTRNTGLLLTHYGLNKPLISYHDHNENDRQPVLMHHFAKGDAVALVSDAGMPLIADPGYRLVQACHDAAVPVTVIPGANAALTALAGSGLPTDRFLFHGFLPPKKMARQKALVDLKHIRATHIFYETPQRLAACLDDMVEVMGALHKSAVARELTKLYEDTRRGSLAELTDYYQKHPPRGEIVILLAPADADTLTVPDIDALLTEHLETLSVRDAVAEVVALTGLKKSDIYARALALTNGHGKDN